MFPSRQYKTNEPSLAVVCKYLTSNTITFLHADDREGALQELIDLLAEQGKLEDKEVFFKAIHNREKVVTTGIGMGVAIPHAKLSGYETFFIALGIHSKGIDWQAVDGLPVRIVFMIGGPDDKQTEYLQLLSRLTSALKDEERRKKMLQLSNPKDIMALFKGL